MKMIGKVLSLFLLSAICHPLSLFSDTIYLKDGKEISTEKYEIKNNRLIVREKNKTTATEIPLENVLKITAKDGSTINFSKKDDSAKKTEKNEKKGMNSHSSGTRISKGF